MKPITQARLKELVHYDPDTGAFTWAKSRPGCRKGDACGRLSVLGYCEIGIDGHLRRANRMAYLYMTGENPAENMDVDHINLDKADNRWANLRLANRSQNNANSLKRSHNTSGAKNVVWDKDRNCWRAQICIDGKKINLGRFTTVEDAVAKVDAVARGVWGEYWRAA